MEASLDTNVIIHLYKADFQDILFGRFEALKVYEFIRTMEMEHHADPRIIELFDKDVDLGKIELITDHYLRSIGMYSVFQAHVMDIKICFEPSDLGEVYAIAMAKTLGCINLVTDDIKERGPHYTLMRIPDSDIMPLAFYEILFLDFLENKITKEEVLVRFNEISNISDLNMKCGDKLKLFIKRFWVSPYTHNEKERMAKFCTDRKIIAKVKLQELKEFL